MQIIKLIVSPHNLGLLSDVKILIYLKFVLKIAAIETLTKKLTKSSTMILTNQ